MSTDQGLQEVVSRNVRVLMAIHDITSQKDLVARLGEGWDSPKLTRSLNGSRRWSLDDLPALARVFGVSPGTLLGNTADLVGASQPTASGSGLPTRLQYHNGDSDRVIAGEKQTLPVNWDP